MCFSVRWFSRFHFCFHRCHLCCFRRSQWLPGRWITSATTEILILLWEATTPGLAAIFSHWNFDGVKWLLLAVESAFWRYFYTAVISPIHHALTNIHVHNQACGPGVEQLCLKWLPAKFVPSAFGDALAAVAAWAVFVVAATVAASAVQNCSIRYMRLCFQLSSLVSILSSNECCCFARRSCKQKQDTRCCLKRNADQGSSTFMAP